jgi:DNA-binding transcriptional ArsR family regulator
VDHGKVVEVGSHDALSQSDGLYAELLRLQARYFVQLEEASLVEVRRQGRSSNYRLNRARLEHVVGGWMGHLEPVGPEQRWSSLGPKSTAALAERTTPARAKRSRATDSQ